MKLVTFTFKKTVVVTATLILTVTISYLMMTKRTGIYQRELFHFTGWLHSQRVTGNEKAQPSICLALASDSARRWQFWSLVMY
jgi:uncharacterized membrane protein YGL010W